MDRKAHKPTAAQNKILKKHYDELLDLERDQLDDLDPRFTKLEGHLEDLLDEWIEEDNEGTKRFAPHRYKSAIKALTILAAGAARAVRESLDDGAPKFQDLAVKHTVVEIAHFSRAQDQVLDSEAVKQQLNDISASGVSSLVPRFESSAKRYQGVVFDDLKERLADKILQGAPVEEMVSELVEDGGPKGLVAVTGIAGDDNAIIEDIPEGLFARYRSRAETYVRTELASVYGQQTQDALEQAAQVIPKLQKQWHCEPFACKDICFPTDDQVVDVDEEFTLGDESTLDYPPAHPRCRCRHSPYFGEPE